VLRDISHDIPSGQIVCMRRAFGLWQVDPAADAWRAGAAASGEVLATGHTACLASNPLTYVFQDFAWLRGRRQCAHGPLVLGGSRLDAAAPGAAIIGRCAWRAPS